jgi:hypothetical protein
MLSGIPLPSGLGLATQSNGLPRSIADVAPRAQDDRPLVALSRRRYGEQARGRKLGTNVDRSIERRNSRRFQIALPLLLRWTGGGSHYDSGHCVNIGQGGMFVLAATTPPVGGEVEIEFVLPPFGSVPRPTRLHCVGRVSRVEVCYQLKGFAVAGQFVDECQAMPTTLVSVDKPSDAI